ncbi:hypothetical protein [Flaviaesturariibacter amylovorans]|uniref:Gliding motility lipoprotein GldD n=1 Tax=Flaviaesturariibacter amylovorans TaxID=1084520 RepID=A0ABP8H8Y1_9BACT
MNRHLYLFALPALVLLCAFRCSRTPDCPPDSGYAFRVASSWEPGLPGYRVGDTLWFTSRFPKALFDERSRQVVVYSEAQVRMALQVYRLDTVRQRHEPAAAEFRYVTVIGTLPDSFATDQRGFRFREDSSGYALRVGLVTQRPGLYAIMATQITSAGRAGLACTFATFSNRLSNPDRFVSLYRNAMGAAAQPDVDERLFAFRVE